MGGPFGQANEVLQRLMARPSETGRQTSCMGPTWNWWEFIEFQWMDEGSPDFSALLTAFFWGIVLAPAMLQHNKQMNLIAALRTSPIPSLGHEVLDLPKDPRVEKMKKVEKEQKEQKEKEEKEERKVEEPLFWWKSAGWKVEWMKMRGIEHHFPLNRCLKPLEYLRLARFPRYLSGNQTWQAGQFPPGDLPARTAGGCCAAVTKLTMLQRNHWVSLQPTAEEQFL